MQTLTNKPYKLSEKLVTILSYITYIIFVLFIAPFAILYIIFIIINNIYNKGMKFGDILKDKNDRQGIYVFYAMYLFVMIPKLLVIFLNDMKQK